MNECICIFPEKLQEKKHEISLKESKTTTIACTYQEW